MPGDQQAQRRWTSAAGSAGGQVKAPSRDDVDELLWLPWLRLLDAFTTGAGAGHVVRPPYRCRPWLQSCRGWARRAAACSIGSLERDEGGDAHAALRCRRRNQVD